MKKIAILSAMSKELDQLKALYPNVEARNLNGLRGFEVITDDKQFFLTESGMGKVCAATNTIEIIREFKPDIIIFSGCAGSLSKNVEVKDIVIGNEIAYHDVWFWKPNKYGQVQGFPARFETDKSVLKNIAKITQNHANIHTGLICTGDKFISQDEDIQNILAEFPDVLAVDMEAAAIAQVCYMYKTPLISIKVISDNPVKYPNGFGQYNEFWSDMADTSFNFLQNLLKVI